MPIKVIFEFEDAAAAIAFLQGGPELAAAGAKRGGKKAAAAPESGAQSPAAPAAQPAAAASAATAASPAATAATVGVATVPAKDVVDALCALADLGGEYHEKAKAILAKYGATSFGKQPNNPASRELDPKHYAAALADFRAAMPPATPTSAASLI